MLVYQRVTWTFECLSIFHETCGLNHQTFHLKHLDFGYGYISPYVAIRNRPNSYGNRKAITVSTSRLRGTQFSDKTMWPYIYYINIYNIYILYIIYIIYYIYIILYYIIYIYINYNINIWDILWHVMRSLFWTRLDVWKLFEVGYPWGFPAFDHLIQDGACQLWSSG